MCDAFVSAPNSRRFKAARWARRGPQPRGAAKARPSRRISPSHRGYQPRARRGWFELRTHRALAAVQLLSGARFTAVSFLLYGIVHGDRMEPREKLRFIGYPRASIMVRTARLAAIVSK